MSTRFRRPTLLAVALAAATTTIAAAPAYAAQAGDDVRTMRVTFSDLDLASASGRQTLDRRIAHASSLVCAQPGTGVDDVTDVARCRDQARTRARTSLAGLGLATN